VLVLLVLLSPWDREDKVRTKRDHVEREDAARALLARLPSERASSCDLT
jgi:hypothetical protein